MRKILIVNCLIIFAFICACSADRDVAERRALMIPKKSEVPRNKKYKEVVYKGKKKYQKKQAKRMKSYNEKNRR
jgi:hypothetical protein